MRRSVPKLPRRVGRILLSDGPWSTSFGPRSTASSERHPDALLPLAARKGSPNYFFTEEYRWATASQSTTFQKLSTYSCRRF